MLGGAHPSARAKNKMVFYGWWVVLGGDGLPRKPPESLPIDPSQPSSFTPRKPADCIRWRCGCGRDGDANLRDGDADLEPLAHVAAAPLPTLDDF